VSPRPRLSQDETEEHARRIVEATFRVIAAKGSADPPIRLILREAGLSRQAFYRCFGSKDDLMVAVRSEGRLILAHHLRVRMGHERGPAEKIRAWVRGVMQQAEAPYAVERTRPFVLSPGGQAIMNRAESAEKERLLCEPLEEAIVAFRAESGGDRGDPGTEALIIHDLVLGSLRRHLVIGVPPSAETVEALADFAIAGVSRGAEGSRHRRSTSRSGAGLQSVGGGSA
jgi:AcrR family transcriptional regulator